MTPDDSPHPARKPRWRRRLFGTGGVLVLSGPGGVTVFDREWPLRVEKPEPATQASSATSGPVPSRGSSGMARR